MFFFFLQWVKLFICSIYLESVYVKVTQPDCSIKTIYLMLGIKTWWYSPLVCLKQIIARKTSFMKQTHEAKTFSENQKVTGMIFSYFRNYVSRQWGNNAICLPLWHFVGVMSLIKLCCITWSNTFLHCLPPQLVATSPLQGDNEVIENSLLIVSSTNRQKCIYLSEFDLLFSNLPDFLWQSKEVEFSFIKSTALFLFTFLFSSVFCQSLCVILTGLLQCRVTDTRQLLWFK